MALCFPRDADRLKLETREPELLSFLLETLSDQYEIYVQPFFCGDRPDFVIVRPDAGVLIIEVKDWSLSSYKVEYGRWRLKLDDTPLRSPFDQVRRTRETSSICTSRDSLTRNSKI